MTRPMRSTARLNSAWLKDVSSILSLLNPGIAIQITLARKLPYPLLFFFFQAEDGIRDHCVTGVQTCALPIFIIRANVDNLPMKENNPNNLSRLTSYLTREQYGDTPLLKGESWDNETQTYVTKVFPRRFSTEPMHEPTRANYTSDGDFLWRYQINHMFVRYVLWNFVGAEGDWQDAGVSWKESFGIPLFIALLGLYFHFQRDWKMASVLM